MLWGTGHTGVFSGLEEQIVEYTEWGWINSGTDLLGRIIFIESIQGLYHNNGSVWRPGVGMQAYTARSIPASALTQPNISVVETRNQDIVLTPNTYWLVSPTATGNLSTQRNNIAEVNNNGTAIRYIVPYEGMEIWHQEEGNKRRYINSVWTVVSEEVTLYYDDRRFGTTGSLQNYAAGNNTGWELQRTSFPTLTRGDDLFEWDVYPTSFGAPNEDFGFNGTWSALLSTQYSTKV